MSNPRTIDLINTMLSRATPPRASVKDQMLYQRGYLTGFLASLAEQDSMIRDQIHRRIGQLEKKRGA
jgi:hypothetical protein